MAWSRQITTISSSPRSSSARARRMSLSTSACLGEGGRDGLGMGASLNLSCHASSNNESERSFLERSFRRCDSVRDGPQGEPLDESAQDTEREGAHPGRNGAHPGDQRALSGIDRARQSIAECNASRTVCGRFRRHGLRPNQSRVCRSVILRWDEACLRTQLSNRWRSGLRSCFGQMASIEIEVFSPSIGR